MNCGVVRGRVPPPTKKNFAIFKNYAIFKNCLNFLYHMSSDLTFVFLYTRSEARSHSVASISPEDVSRLQEEVRVKKPWNEWRRISLMGKKEKKDLFQDFQNQTGDQKKSFESWLIGKEVMREEFEQQLLEEEHMKQLEKERIEEERKMK